MKFFIFLMMLAVLDGSLSSCTPANGNQNTNVNPNNNVSVNTNKTEMKEEKIKLEATFSLVNEKQLKVSYKVTNNDSADVFLLNRLPNRGADFSSVGAGKCYLVPTDDGVIEISKRAFFISANDTASSSAPVLPAAIRLAAGQKFEEEFNVALPFQISHPYKDTAKLPAISADANKVRFCLGVVSGDTINNTREQKRNGEIHTILNANDIKNQQLICSSVQSLR